MNKGEETCIVNMAMPSLSNIDIEEKDLAVTISILLVLTLVYK